MKHILIMNLLITLIFTGCSSTPSKSVSYSKEEQSKLLFCTSLSDIAFVVATRKQEGVKIEDVRKEYASAKDQKLINAIINKVYGDHIANTLDYQKAFFTWCGVEVANVSSKRMPLAEFCNDIQFLSGVIYSMKKKGTSRSDAKTKLNATDGDLVSSIVDSVYDTNGSMSDIKTGLWNACIASNKK